MGAFGVLSMAVAIVAATATVAAESTVAAPFHRIASGVGAFSSDGVRYAAWQLSPGTPVVVLDSSAHRRWSVGVSADCRLYDEHSAGMDGPPAGAGRFLLNCGTAQELLDVRTGRSTNLPGNALGPNWDAVGARYVAGVAANEKRCRQSPSEINHERPCIALFDIATERVSERPQSQVGDLDRLGAPLVCRGLRRSVIKQRAGSLPMYFAYSNGTLARPTGHRGDVEVDRCHGRRAVLPGGGEPRDFELGAGILTWDTGHDAESFSTAEEFTHGEVRSYRIATQRRQHRTLPALPLQNGSVPPLVGVFGYSAHTATTLFWIVAEDLVGRESGVVDRLAVYAAPLL
jgi:hypothetical protein